MALIAAEVYALVVALVMWLAWWALGDALLERSRVQLRPAERLAVAMLLGAAMIGTSAFILGQIYYGRALAVVALAPLALFARVAARARFGELLRALRSLRAWPALLSLALWAVLVAAALAEPAGDIENDEIAYHLLGPVVWLREGRLRPVLDHACTAFPPLHEVLFGLGMAVGNSRVPALLAMLLAGALLLLVVGWAQAVGVPSSRAALAAALVAAMPPVLAPSSSAFVDAGFAAFVLAGLRLVLLEDSPVLAGLLFGGALGSKYTGISALGITFGCALLVGLSRARWRALLTTAIVAVAVGAPAYVRNWLVLGSPIYPPPPAMMRLFHPKAFSAAASEQLAHYLLIERGSGLGKTVSRLLALPWNLTFFTAFFNGAGGIGIAPLALAPAGFARIPGRLRLPLVAWLALSTSFWFFTQQETRFLAPVLALLACVAMLGADWLIANAGRGGRSAVLAVVSLSILFGGAEILRSRKSELLAVISPARAAARIAAADPFRGAFEFLNGESNQTRVLILNPAVPPYFLHREYLKLRGPYGERPIDGAESWSDVRGRAQVLGFDEVLDVQTRWEGFQLQAEPDLKLVFDSPDARVYRVVSGS